MPQANGNTELQPTPASEWGKKKSPESGFLCQLPSGEVVRIIRTLDLPVLLKAGQIPNPLNRVLRRMLNERQTAIPDEALEDPKMLEQLLNLLYATAKKMMIEPEISIPRPRGIDENGVRFEESEDEYDEYLQAWEPEDGMVPFHAIDVTDLMYLFAVGQGMAADLESFRFEPNATVDSVPTVKRVVKPTKRTSGSK